MRNKCSIWRFPLTMKKANAAKRGKAARLGDRRYAGAGATVRPAFSGSVFLSSFSGCNPLLWPSARFRPCFLAPREHFCALHTWGPKTQIKINIFLFKSQISQNCTTSFVFLELGNLFIPNKRRIAFYNF